MSITNQTVSIAALNRTIIRGGYSRTFSDKDLQVSKFKKENAYLQNQLDTWKQKFIKNKVILKSVKNDPLGIKGKNVDNR